jgi:hypothetical protein
VRELAAGYGIQEVVHDPWRFQQAALELEREGLLVVAFPQSNPRMVRLQSGCIERSPKAA